MRRTLPPAGLIGLACAILILSILPLATFPSLIPTFRAVWGISNTEAGWISGVYFAGMLGAVAVFTALTDRVDPKLVFVAGLAIGALATAGFAFAAGGAWSAGFWRLLQGIGLGGTYMPGLKLLTDLLPVGTASRATSFYTATYYLGAALSYVVALEGEAALGWRATFALVALGPLAGLVLALAAVPGARAPGPRPETRLLDYRPVVRSRRALGFALIYGLHNLELFAFTSWLVPLLVFSRALGAPDAVAADWNLGGIAALVSVVALPASIAGNEIAQRIGRQPVIVAVMLVSAATGVVLGAASGAAFWLVIALCLLYSATIAADSATMTAGVVQVAAPRYKGTTMSLYAIVGFGGAFLGPAIFGAALDLGGGETAPHAWLGAFATIAALTLLGPVVVRRLIGTGPL